MKKIIVFVWSVFLLTQALPVSASCADFREDAEYDGYLVALADGAAAPDAGEWEAVLPGVIRTDDLSLARKLLADGVAEYVETNDVVRLFDTDAPRVQDGWVYEAANAACAEELGLSGAAVRIAVIDSGVDRENGDLRCAVIEAGYDYLAESGKTMRDDVGHGTQVVQMIAADRNDRGGTGIARGAVIVPLRCFGESDSLKAAGLARAIYEAVDKYDCDIINMSWGLKTDNRTLHEAVRYAYERGCILVAAAGNVSVGDPQGTVFYPAAYDEVIGVGAVTRTGDISAYSQQTAAVSVCAPGEAVPVWLNGEYVNTGTSFAAPCVSAMLALARERLPSLDGAAARLLVRERAVDRGAAVLWRRTDSCLRNISAYTAQIALCLIRRHGCAR